MTILLAYFHRYGWIVVMLLIMYLTKKPDVVMGISVIVFSIWTFLGYILRWKHIYCSYQDACHMRMTPEKVQWDTVKESDAFGVPAIFLILGVFLLVAQG